MSNDDYILFEHKFTVKDSKNLLNAVICLFLILCICLFLFFNIGSILQTQTFLKTDLYFFGVVIGIIFVIACSMLRFSTFAKIVLTEDKIIYKPPIGSRFYEMEYFSIKHFCYEKTTLFVLGENQQRLAVCLAKNVAEKIIDILNIKISNGAE
mgnify:FL=1